ncbi:hypothetical protein HYX14_01970 [Candidatus Woesearchaeota archaeon]|nr:hypothetical protein [Candidatus Woesearchaeota archaeon]
MISFSPLCQLNGGCMGCCGYGFISVEKIKEAVAENTTEFQQANPQAEDDFLQFRNRRPAMDLRHGVCRNLIEENGCVLCPLHPARHGKDLRMGHCDTDYFCKTAKTFANWSPEKQQQFVDFIKRKELDNITYSLQMDKGMLLREFERNVPPNI